MAEFGPTEFRRSLAAARGVLMTAAGCGKTVLDSFQASLSVLEHAGRVPESEMFCKDATWLSHLASLNADLRTAAP